MSRLPVMGVSYVPKGYDPMQFILRRGIGWGEVVFIQHLEDRECGRVAPENVLLVSAV